MDDEENKKLFWALPSGKQKQSSSLLFKQGKTTKHPNRYLNKGFVSMQSAILGSTLVFLSYSVLRETGQLDFAGICIPSIS